MPVKSKVKVSKNFVAFSEYMINLWWKNVLPFYKYSYSNFRKTVICSRIKVWLNTNQDRIKLWLKTNWFMSVRTITPNWLLNWRKRIKTWRGRIIFWTMKLKVWFEPRFDWIAINIGEREDKNTKLTAELKKKNQNLERQNQNLIEYQSTQDINANWLLNWRKRIKTWRHRIKVFGWIPIQSD